MQKVEDLIKVLETEDISNLISIFNNSSIPKSEFEKYASWTDEGYTRNCIARNSKFEAILLCWKPGQGSSIHGHDSQKCIVHIVQGELEEKLYTKEIDSVKLIRESIFSEGQTTYMEDDMGYHSIKNSSNINLMTLHIYMNPIDKCEVFDSESKEFYTKDLVYDTDSMIK